MENLKQNVDAVVKFVTKVYSPVKSKTQVEYIKEDESYLIYFYFDKPPASGLMELKNKIRKDIYDYLRIKTFGKQFQNSENNLEDHPIHIFVLYAS